MTTRISTAQYAALTGVKTAPRTARSRPTSPATARAGGPSKAKSPTKEPRKRKTPPVLAAVARLPVGAPSRGPWMVAVECLEGRPITVNDERSGARSYRTYKEIREAQASWKAGFVEAILHAGIPPLRQAFVTIQALYPNDVVPDTDGLATVIKPALDALVEAGVLANDKRAQLPLAHYPLPPVSDGGLPRVAMTIHPLS